MISLESPGNRSLLPEEGIEENPLRDYAITHLGREGLENIAKGEPISFMDGSLMLDQWQGDDIPTQITGTFISLGEEKKFQLNIGTQTTLYNKLSELKKSIKNPNTQSLALKILLIKNIKVLLKLEQALDKYKAKTSTLTISEGNGGYQVHHSEYPENSGPLSQIKVRKEGMKSEGTFQDLFEKLGRKETVEKIKEKALTVQKKRPGVNRYDPHVIARNLLKELGVKPNLLKAAINELRKEDPRFNGINPNLNPMNKTIDEVVVVLDKYIDETQVIGEKKLKKKKKIKVLVAQHLIALVDRKIVEGPDGVLGLKQLSGHIENIKNPRLLPGALDAEIQKQRASKVDQLANWGVIYNKDGVLLSRSSRSDSERKVREKSVADITARLNVGENSGLEYDAEGGYYIYRRIDGSLMDKSLKKAVATTGQGIRRGNRPENERLFLKKKEEAIDKIWSKDVEYIEHKILNKNGDYVTVREYKPQVMNFVFSGQAKKAKNVKEARIANRPAMLQMYKKFIQKNTELGPEEKNSYIKMINQAIDNPSEKNIEELVEMTYLLKDKGVRDLKAIKGIIVSLQGKYKEDGKTSEYDNKESTDLYFLYASYLADLTGFPLTMECKSGNDRTAVAVALYCARKELEARGPESFEFENLRTNDDFKVLFLKYLDSFGGANIRASRPFKEHKTYNSETNSVETKKGYQFKIEKNVVFQKYFDSKLKFLSLDLIITASSGEEKRKLKKYKAKQAKVS